MLDKQSKDTFSLSVVLASTREDEWKHFDLKYAATCNGVIYVISGNKFLGWNLVELQLIIVNFQL